MKKIVVAVVLVLIVLVSIRVAYIRIIELTTPTAFLLSDVVEGHSGPSESNWIEIHLRNVYGYPVIGRDSAGTWWQLGMHSGGSTWVHESDVSLSRVENVPIVATPCTSTISPSCPVSQETRTVTVEFFEEGISLRISDYRLVIVLGYYADDMEYGYLDTFPNIWGAPESQASLDNSRPSGIGEVIEASVVTYSTTLELFSGENTPHDDMTYLRLPDGRGIGFDTLSGHWFFVE